MNKKLKDIIKIVVILSILLLLAGAFLLKEKVQKTETKLSVNKEEGQVMVVTEEESAEEHGDLGTFVDKTTNKKQATDAGVKGGSETLEIISSEKESDEDKTTNQKQETDAEIKDGAETSEIISPEEEKENEEDTDKFELIWLPGVW